MSLRNVALMRFETFKVALNTRVVQGFRVVSPLLHPGHESRLCLNSEIFPVDNGGRKS